MLEARSSSVPPAGAASIAVARDLVRPILWRSARSPYPLSEKYCLASYSFDTLRGEPYFNH